MAVSDFQGNIHILKDLAYSHSIFQAHSRLVTDLEWVFSINERNVCSDQEGTFDGRFFSQLRLKEVPLSELRE